MPNRLRPPTDRVAKLLDYAEYRLTHNADGTPTKPLPSDSWTIPACRRLLELRRQNNDADLCNAWYDTLGVMIQARFWGFRLSMVMLATSGNLADNCHDWTPTELRAAAVGFRNCLFAMHESGRAQMPDEVIVRKSVEADDAH